MATRKIKVFVNKDANPQVQVPPIVYGKGNIRWQQGIVDSTWEFHDISFPENSALSDKQVRVGGEKITCKNARHKNGDHEYVIQVKDVKSGDIYESTVVSPPSGDKPVIRN